jgi:hypothetical protein
LVRESRHWLNAIQTQRVQKTIKETTHAVCCIAVEWRQEEGAMFYPSMLYQTETAFANRAIHNQFERLHVQGLRRRIWTGVTGRRHTLLNLHEVSKQITVHTRNYAGVRLVPIDQIRGSEGRHGDFDAGFRPLNRHNQARWISIALARQNDVALPLVELVQVGDVYFVRDGHHRISVARALGQRDIEAEVTVWHCSASSPVTADPETARPAALAQLHLPEVGQRLLKNLGEQLVAAGNKLQALAQVGSNRAAMQGS